MTAVRSDSNLDRAEVERIERLREGLPETYADYLEALYQHGPELCRLALAVMDAPVGTMAVDAHPWPTIDDTPDWEEGTRVRLVRVGEE